MTHLGVNKLMDLWNSLSTSYGQRVMTRSLQVQQNLTKRHISVHTKDIINLTNDKPLEEFEMVVDLPSDEDDDEMVMVKNEPGNDYRGQGQIQRCILLRWCGCLWHWRRGCTIWLVFLVSILVISALTANGYCLESPPWDIHNYHALFNIEFAMICYDILWWNDLLWHTSAILTSLLCSTSFNCCYFVPIWFSHRSNSIAWFC